MISGFIALATGVRGYPKLKGFSYTLWIFTAVTASMFYPQYFLSVGNFQFKKSDSTSASDNYVWHGIADELCGFCRSDQNAKGCDCGCCIPLYYYAFGWLLYSKDLFVSLPKLRQE